MSTQSIAKCAKSEAPENHADGEDSFHLISLNGCGYVLLIFKIKIIKLWNNF